MTKTAAENILDANCLAIGEALRKVGAGAAKLTYSGSGDSGNGVDISLGWKKGDGQGQAPGEVAYTYLASTKTADDSGYEKTPAIRTTTFNSALEDIWEQAIEAAGHSGWENEDGGVGTFTVLASGSATLEHGDCVVTVEESSLDFDNTSGLMNLETFASALRAAGLTSATARYLGGGDSGEVSEITYDGDGNPDSLGDVTYQVTQMHHVGDGKFESAFSEQTANFSSAFEDFAFHAVSAAGHGGWENNEGGQGSFLLRADGTALLSHENNFDSYDYTTTTFGPNEAEAKDELEGPSF